MENNENVEVLATFFKCKGKYYLICDNKTEEIKNYTINKLKEKLDLPFKVQFMDLSKNEIRNIICSLLDNNIDVSINKFYDKRDLKVKYEALFYSKIKCVQVYKVNSKGSIFRIKNNCNPYLYTELNGKKVLIEVSKDYAKNNLDNVYFLADDLTVVEKVTYDMLYNVIECDCIYKMDREEVNNKEKGKIIKKQLK